jgi:hypothetical protein
MIWSAKIFLDVQKVGILVRQLVYHRLFQQLVEAEIQRLKEEAVALMDSQPWPLRCIRVHLMLWVLHFLSLPQLLIHSVWILNLGLQAKVRKQTMPGQARTHLEGQERATQRGKAGAPYQRFIGSCQPWSVFLK